MTFNRLKGVRYRWSRLPISLFVLVFSLALSAVAPSAAQDQKVLRAVIGPAGTNVIWDVALATDTTSHTFIEMMFPGLVPREETTGVPEPGMAESWDISEDARTYTFHLKQGVPWVTYDFDADEVVQVTDEPAKFAWSRPTTSSTARCARWILKTRRLRVSARELGRRWRCLQHG